MTKVIPASKKCEDEDFRKDRKYNMGDMPWPVGTVLKRSRWTYLVVRNDKYDDTKKFLIIDNSRYSRCLSDGEEDTPYIMHSHGLYPHDLEVLGPLKEVIYDDE